MMVFANAFALLLLIAGNLNVQFSVAQSHEPDVDLAFKTYAPKSGLDESLTPLILLHGISSTKSSWAKIGPILAEKSKRKVYALDARDHGDSPRVDHFNVQLEVQDLLHFLDSKNIKKAILIGHSMGGRTTLYSAMQKPEMFEKIFVEDMYLAKLPRATIDTILALLTWRQKSLSEMPKGLSPEEALKWSNDYIMKNLPKDSPLRAIFHEKARQDIRRKPDGSYELNFNYDILTNYLKNNPHPFYIEPNGQFNGPAYFLYGGKSFVGVQNDKETILKHFPKAKFIEFPEAGHDVHATSPKKYVETVMKYL